MTKAEKLEALIGKAIERGWTGSNLVDTEAFYLLQGVGPYDVIFDHDFAKALFGGERYTYHHDGYKRYEKGDLVASKLDPRIPAYSAIEDKDFWSGGVTYEPYEYYLQQAVISDDPIDYMYKAVFSE